MGYYATVTGRLSLQEESRALEAASILAHLPFKIDWNGREVVFDKERGTYNREDYDALARCFNGQIDFIGKDGNHWTLFLKDDTVTETAPLEIEVKPDETPAQSIGRYISEQMISPQQVLEAMPEYVGGKVWLKNDYYEKMAVMDLSPDVADKIVDRAIELTNKDQFNDCYDEDWEAIEAGIEDALEAYEESKPDICYVPRLEITNESETVEAWQDWGSFSNLMDAISVAERLRKEAVKGKFSDRLTPEQKENGFYLNIAIETVQDGALVQVEDWAKL